jgi:uncharacterized lipoprotein YddW (UPF0748 family)
MTGTLLLIAGSTFAGVLISASPDEAGKPARKASPPSAPAVNEPEATRPAAAEEVRAVWVTRWDFKTEADVRKIVAGCAALGFNRVIFQVRGEADAYYRSSFEPWAEDLGGPPERGGDPGFDPLKAAVEEAHRRGITLHAWANVLPGWKGTIPPRSPNHLVHVHPEWFLPDRSGRPKTFDHEHYAMLNPCLAAVRAHLARVLGEIAERYPVDGIQIDYIRYLDRDTSPDKRASYGRGRPLLAAGTEVRPGERTDPDAIRRKAMDLLLSDISRAVHRRPGIRLSMAAIRDAARARESLCQDAEAWKRRGWVDDVYPMNYDPDMGKFGECSRRWVKACGGESVVIGIGVHLLDGVGGLREQIRILRGEAAAERPAGYCLFAVAEFFNTPSPESRTDPESQARKAQLRALLVALNRTAAKPAVNATQSSPAPRPPAAAPKSDPAPSPKTDPAPAAKIR